MDTHIFIAWSITFNQKGKRITKTFPFIIDWFSNAAIRKKHNFIIGHYSFPNCIVGHTLPVATREIGIYINVQFEWVKPTCYKKENIAWNIFCHTILSPFLCFIVKVKLTLQFVIFFFSFENDSLFLNPVLQAIETKTLLSKVISSSKKYSNFVERKTCLTITSISTQTLPLEILEEKKMEWGTLNQHSQKQPASFWGREKKLSQ